MNDTIRKGLHQKKALQFETKALSAFIKITAILFLAYGSILISLSEVHTTKDLISGLSTLLFTLFSWLCLRILKRQLKHGYQRREIYRIRNIYITFMMLYVYSMVLRYFNVSFLLVYLVIATTGMIYLNPLYYTVFVLLWMLAPFLFLTHMANTPLVDHIYYIINNVVTILFALTINYVYTIDRYHLFELESQLESERDTDALTGLMNKRHFHATLEEYKPSSDMAVAILVDLDNFKQVNDTFGHSAGDQVLIQVAQILKSVFRAEDHAARIGGDEFSAFFMVKTIDWSSIEAIARHKIKALLDNVPIVVCKGGTEIHVTFSIGICVQSMADGMSPIDILAMADAAMYELKSTSKNGGCICLGNQPLIKILGHSDNHIGCRLELPDEPRPLAPVK